MDDYQNEAMPVGAAEVAAATQTLQRYKAGKAALDRRLVDNELWFRMGHWKNYQNPHDARQGAAQQWMAVQQHRQQARRCHGQLPGTQCAAPCSGR